MNAETLKAEHGPGPWSWLDCETYYGRWRIPISSARGRLVANAFGISVGEAEANARLIAAAPETAAERDWLRDENKRLMEANVAMHWALATFLAWTEAGRLNSPVLRKAQEQGRAAIALAGPKPFKAEGGPA